MNPNSELIKGCVILLMGIVLSVLSAILVFIASKFAFKEHLTIIVITTLFSLVGASFIIPMGIEKVSFFTQFQDTKSKIDGISLSILAGKSRGLLFVNPEMLGLTEGAVRHLISLQLVKSEIFPETLNLGYSLTDLGRYILEKTLKFNLYPKSFCDLIRVRYWEGYPKEFLEAKNKFEKDNKISWDKCWENLAEQIKKEDPELKGDAVAAFNSYKDKNSFDTVMNKIVNPWLKQIKK